MTIPDPPRFTRRLYLLRHADVRYFDEQGRPQPPNEVPLSAQGCTQAKAMGELLREIPFDRVVTSDLQRTQQTAQIILEQNEQSPPKIEAISALREIQPGRLADLSAREAREAFLGGFASTVTRESRFLGGEEVGSFVDRVEKQVQQLLRSRDWSRTLMVAHGGVNRVVLMRAWRADLAGLGAVEQDPCCLNVIDVDENVQLLVRLVNYTPYSLLKEGMQYTTMEKLFLEYRQES